MPRFCTHMNSVPERLTPRSRAGSAAARAGRVRSGTDVPRGPDAAADTDPGASNVPIRPSSRARTPAAQRFLVMERRSLIFPPCGVGACGTPEVRTPGDPGRPDSAGRGRHGRRVIAQKARRGAGGVGGVVVPGDAEAVVVRVEG